VGSYVASSSLSPAVGSGRWAAGSDAFGAGLVTDRGYGCDRCRLSKLGLTFRTSRVGYLGKRGFPLRYSWLLAGRGFRGSGDAGPQHLVVTRFQEYQDGNPLLGNYRCCV
jgi:hypothetical protein